MYRNLRFQCVVAVASKKQTLQPSHEDKRQTLNRGHYPNAPKSMRGEINEVLAQVIATRKVSEKQKWGAPSTERNQKALAGHRGCVESK